MAKNQYKFGRAIEQKLAQSLRSKGLNVEMSKGSKGTGAADLRVRFSTGTKWAVRVKYSRGSTASSPSSRDMDRLKRVATKSNATPVVAKVTQEGIEFISARSGRKLLPPKRKK